MLTVEVKIMTLRSLFGALAAAFAAGCASPTIPAVEELDLARYMGTWYEVARTPNWFEDGMDRVSADYALRPDGTVSVKNSGEKNGEIRSVTGTARRKKGGRPGELEVSFFRPFYGDYRIVMLDPEYRFAAVAGSGGKCWILSRTPTLPENTLNGILSFFTTHGIPKERFLFPKP